MCVAFCVLVSRPGLHRREVGGGWNSISRSLRRQPLAPESKRFGGNPRSGNRSGVGLRAKPAPRGFSLFSPSPAAWFAATPENAPTISGFLYLTVTSLAAGMTITAIRWAIVDQLHAITGLRPPKLDFSRLATRVDAFNLLIEIHYRHYQFYSNAWTATAIAYICHRIHLGTLWHVDLIDPGFVLLEAIFFMTSRDTLRRYYQRTEQLLSQRHVSTGAGR